MALTAIVVIVAILSDNNAENIDVTPSPTQTEQPAPATTDEPEVVEEPTKVLILRSDIIGENLSTVTATLTELGFEVNAIPGELIPGEDPRARTVYAVSPTGSIEKGSRIDVTYYVGNFEDIPVEIPAPEEPVTESPTTSDTASAEVTASPEVTDGSETTDSGTSG